MTFLEDMNMPTKIFSKFILGVSMVLLLSSATISYAADNPAICHHPASAPADHSEDIFLAYPGGGHQPNGNGTHVNDHYPLSDGTCGGGTVDPTPEPVTMLLFGAGIAGVGYAARRRKRRAEMN